MFLSSQHFFLSCLAAKNLINNLLKQRQNQLKHRSLLQLPTQAQLYQNTMARKIKSQYQTTITQHRTSAQITVLAAAPTNQANVQFAVWT